MIIVVYLKKMEYIFKKLLEVHHRRNDIQSSENLSTAECLFTGMTIFSLCLSDSVAILYLKVKEKQCADVSMAILYLKGNYKRDARISRAMSKGAINVSCRTHANS